MTLTHSQYALLQNLVKIRRTLHQYPELSFQEYETTKRIVQELQYIPGIKIETGKEKVGLDTGVVARLSKGKGKTIAIRADIDALPIHEENEHSYVSKHEGKMHACGHDGHTTIGIGAALLVAEAFKKGELEGTVKFIFQPAEEMEDEQGLTGSPYMLKSGVLDDVDAVIALHLDPRHPLGEILLHAGPSMANVDTFTAAIRGTGGHAAYPEEGTDPIWMLSSILPSLYSLSGRKVSALQPAVLSIGQIEGGSSNNIIPEKVTIKGTIRTYDDHTRALLSKELENVLSTVKHAGGSYELCMNNGEPALNNDPIVCSWLEKTIHELYPSYKVINKPYGLGGEDFGYMTQCVPGAMFFLGASVEDNQERGLHMPKFDFQEEALATGANILATTAIRYLKNDYKMRGGIC